MCESGKGVSAGSGACLRTVPVKAGVIWGLGGTQAEMHIILYSRKKKPEPNPETGRMLYY